MDILNIKQTIEGRKAELKMKDRHQSNYIKIPITVFSSY